MKLPRQFDLLVFFILGLTYLLLPNHNPTMDSYSYAAHIRYQTELFWPHHLLYNTAAYLFNNFFSIFDGDGEVIHRLQRMNGLAMIACLYFLYNMLKLMEMSKKTAMAWVFLVGSSFAAMRYATENETYVLPIAFSLFASLAYLKWRKSNSATQLVISGIAAAAACLFHQIHVFWWLGLLLPLLARKEWKNIGLYGLPALMIPAAYVLVLAVKNSSLPDIGELFRYMFEYYFKDSAEVSIVGKNFILTPISFVRSFIQVHGNIYDLLMSRPIAWLAVLISLACLSYALTRKKAFRFNKQKNQLLHGFGKTHLLIFCLQLFFAFFSHGNAEFMVMLPFLIPVFLPTWITVSTKSVWFIGLALYCWNLGLAILPNKLIDYNNHKQVIAHIRSHPNHLYILKDNYTARTAYLYEYGEELGDRILGTSQRFTDRLDGNRNYKGVFTDIYSKRVPFNRAALVSKSSMEENLKRIKAVDSIDYFYGTYTLDSVEVLQ